MSDKPIQDEDADNISGGMGTHPFPRDPVRPPAPPTHPGGVAIDPIEPPRTNPTG